MVTFNKNSIEDIVGVGGNVDATVVPFVEENSLEPRSPVYSSVQEQTKSGLARVVDVVKDVGGKAGKVAAKAVMVVGLAATVAACQSTKWQGTPVKGGVDRNVANHVEADGCPPIKSGYGDSYDINQKRRDFPHDGIDIPSPTGYSIIAAAPGEVIAVGDQGPGGKTIAVYHGTDPFGNHAFSIHFHLHSYAVGIGNTVKRGQKIGEVGASGSWNADGTPHLHFGSFVTPDGTYLRNPNGSIYAGRHTKVNPNIFIRTQSETRNVWEPFQSRKEHGDKPGLFSGFTYPLPCKGK